jgi:hypothetical protein
MQFDYVCRVMRIFGQSLESTEWPAEMSELQNPHQKNIRNRQRSAVTHQNGAINVPLRRQIFQWP